MIDGVQDEALVPVVGAQVRLIEQRIADGEAGLPVALLADAVAEPQQALRGDGGGRAVHRLMRVEGIGGARQVIAHACQARRAGVPVRDAIGGGMLDIEIAGRAGGHSTTCGLHIGADRSLGVQEFHCSAKPHMAQARPRVQVVKGE